MEKLCSYVAIIFITVSMGEIVDSVRIATILYLDMPVIVK